MKSKGLDPRRPSCRDCRNSRRAWTARDLVARLSLVPWLAGVFFVGGVGRALSYAAVGAPHPFFLLLMALELTTPLLLAGLWLGARSAR